KTRPCGAQTVAPFLPRPARRLRPSRPVRPSPPAASSEALGHRAEARPGHTDAVIGAGDCGNVRRGRSAVDASDFEAAEAQASDGEARPLLFEPGVLGQPRAVRAGEFSGRSVWCRSRGEPAGPAEGAAATALWPRPQELNSRSPHSGCALKNSIHALRIPAAPQEPDSRRPYFKAQPSAVAANLRAAFLAILLGILGGFRPLARHGRRKQDPHLVQQA